MLVSVTERTREIGVRMAVGAKPWHVLAQFLAEAVTLSMIGGLLGIMLGSVIARVVAARLGWAYTPHVDMILLSFGFSAAVGVGFGLYPARKASRLDPIEALRFEQGSESNDLTSPRKRSLRAPVSVPASRSGAWTTNPSGTVETRPSRCKRHMVRMVVSMVAPTSDASSARDSD